MMTITAIILVYLGKLATSTMEDEGMACMDMAAAIPNLQTMTGRGHHH